MKAITLHQPWASAIMSGMKQYETRSRKTNHRGPIAIHAGRTYDGNAMKNPSLSGLPWRDHIQLPVTRLWGSPMEDDFPKGSIIAVGDLTDCLLMDEELISKQSGMELVLGHWEPGRYAYKIENIRKVGPFEVRGKQGLWNWDEEGLTDV